MSFSIEVMLQYRTEKKYLLHEFVVMPDHFHVIITPTGITLERAMQLIKGEFSYQLNKKLKIKRDVWLGNQDYSGASPICRFARPRCVVQPPGSFADIRPSYSAACFSVDGSQYSNCQTPFAVSRFSEAKSLIMSG